ncbi:MAG: LamG domain-containing protein [Gammaproteobacteria bacterium]
MKSTLNRVLVLALALTASPALAGVIDTADRYWTFDGTADDSVVGVAGTLQGDATYTTDRHGNSNSAVSLDGLGDYVSVAAGSDLGAVSSWTISTWVNVSGFNGASRLYLMDTRGDATSGYGPAMFLDPTNGDDYRFKHFLSPPNTEASVDVTLDVGDWHMLTLSYDETRSLSARTEFFLDGIPQSGISFTYGPNDPSFPFDLNHGWRLGTFANAGAGSEYYFQGALDDMAFWNRSLSAAEVGELFTSTPAVGVPVPPVWTLYVLAALLPTGRSWKRFRTV